MLPAEKTHYRKGLALGFTLAEVFTIIIFILLLVCALLLERGHKNLVTALQDKEKVEIDFAMAEQILAGGIPSGVNTDAWLRAYQEEREELALALQRIERLVADSTRGRTATEELQNMLEEEGAGPDLATRTAQQHGEIDVLRDSLARSENARTMLESRLGELESDLQEARRIGEIAREAITRHGRLGEDESKLIIEQADRVSSLADSLEHARDTIASLLEGQKKWDSLDGMSESDSLRAIVAREARRAEAIRRSLAIAWRDLGFSTERAELREAELSSLRGGRGIDPPPCWLNVESNPEYIFQAILMDAGIILNNIAPRHRSSDAAMVFAAAIQDGELYSPEQFLSLTRPIFLLGQQRTTSGPAGCRYWIQPEDRTGGEKDVFRAREADLWKRFWFRWPN